MFVAIKKFKESDDNDYVINNSNFLIFIRSGKLHSEKSESSNN